MRDDIVINKLTNTIADIILILIDYINYIN